jgi:hypothetical protein
MADKQPNKLFKLLEDFMTAEKIIKSFEKKKPTSEAFEQKIRASYLQISNLIDVELDNICDKAPPYTLKDEPGTDETTSERI